MRYSKIALATILIMGSSQLQAEMLAAAEEDLMLLYEDEEMISIATGTYKPIHLAPSVAHVITAEDIKTSGATKLDQVLEMVPGIHVSLSTVNRLNYVYSIRGIHTGQNPQALILMNGHPFRSASSGARPNGFHYPVENIERIEVMRGPGSAVYGADAFAGVINIITKDADSLAGLSAGARSGSFGSQSVWLQNGQTLNDWDVAFSFEYLDSDGDDERIINSDAQTGLDAIFTTNASLAPGTLDTRYEVLNTQLEMLRDEWKVLLWNWQLKDGGNGAGGGQALDPMGHLENNTLMLDVEYNNPNYSDNWGLKSNLNYHRLDEHGYMNIYPAGANIGFGVLANGLIGNPGGVTQDLSYEVVGFYKALQNHQLRFSAGVIHSEMETKETKNFGSGVTLGTLTDVSGTPNIFMPNSKRNIAFVSAQDEWRLASDWELTAGIRYDDYSDFGNTTNPRLALVWATDYNLTSKLLYGRAFRAPSFGELHYINNPVTLGNKNVQPETIDTLELAFDYRPNFDVHTMLSLFTYKVKDLIDFAASGGGNKTAQNATDQDGYGLEAELEWDLTDTFVLKTNYAWQDSENADSGADVIYAPGQQASLSGVWMFKLDWSLGSQVNWVADRNREIGDSRPEIADYTIVDLTLRRANLMEHWEFSGSIRNMFDKDAREPSAYDAATNTVAIADDYPLEGRSVYLEARYHLD